MIWKKSGVETTPPWMLMITLKLTFILVSKAETCTGGTTVEISLLDAFGDKITITQVDCEPKLAFETSGSPATVTTIDKPQVVDPAADPSPQPSAIQVPETTKPTTTAAQSLESNWSVGDQCWAVWSKDAEVFPATIQSIDGEHCTVQFDGYESEEDMPLSFLKPLELQGKSTQVWSPGSLCRATFSDGLSYPAVVVWLHKQRCRVRFIHSNNEEELNVSGLLRPDELNGPGRTIRAQHKSPSRD